MSEPSNVVNLAEWRARRAGLGSDLAELYRNLSFATAALQADLAGELERCPVHDTPAAVCASSRFLCDAARSAGPTVESLTARVEQLELELDVRGDSYDSGTASRHDGG